MSESRPPFVSFETRPVEDRAATVANGYFTTKDVDYIVLIPHGSEGRTRIEQVYTEWLKKIRPQAGGALRPVGASQDTPDMAAARFPYEWLAKIEEGYKAWKSGQEMPVDGESLKVWAPISPSQRENCLALHIRTVEELAEASDEAVERLGMGAVALRKLAQDYLKNKTSGSAKLAVELEAARAHVKNLEARIQQLTDEVGKLQQKAAA